MAEIKRIKIGAASCGLAAGAGEVVTAFRALNLAVPVVETGCIGHCYAEPLVEVELTDNTSVFYSRVKGDEKSISNIFSIMHNSYTNDDRLCRFIRQRNC